MMRGSLFLAFLALISYFLPAFSNLVQMISAVTLIIVLALWMIATTEKALKEKFPSPNINHS